MGRQTGSKDNSREPSKNDEDQVIEEEDEFDDGDEDDDEAQAPLTTRLRRLGILQRGFTRFISGGYAAHGVPAYPSYFDQLRVVRVCGHENGVVVVF